MDDAIRFVELEVSLHGDTVEGVMLCASRPDQRFRGYLELIQILETERRATSTSEQPA